MTTITTVQDMASAAARLKAEGKTIGFVPTMGYLHEGHLSLVRAARKAADVTVVSIFVNPTQFGPNEDYAKYPRDVARDARMLAAEGTDILFYPEASEMYPAGFKTYVEVRDLQDKLCGRQRPGHFRGVCTVVLKLFEIVRPDVAVFGWKDAQQAIIIERVARDLDLGVRIDVRPTVREPDGLAMSSRNAYLSPAERRAALVLSRGLEDAKGKIAAGERRADVIVGGLRRLIEKEPLARVEYVEAVDRANLEPCAVVAEGTLIVLAVYIGKTRLIDNLDVHL